MELYKYIGEADGCHLENDVRVAVAKENLAMFYFDTKTNKYNISYLTEDELSKKFIKIDVDYNSQQPLNFLDELIKLINKCSKENESNTPDYILADFLNSQLKVFAQTTLKRDNWYGFNVTTNTTNIETSK